MSATPVADLRGAPRLLDELLAEQRSLSAVETFTQLHDEGAVPGDARVSLVGTEVALSTSCHPTRNDRSR